MSLSDGKRQRARASLGASLQSRFDGLLKGLTVQAGAVCPLRGVALDIVDLRQRVTMQGCALVPVGSELRHVDLHFLPEDPFRPPPGGGWGKGEAGGAVARFDAACPCGGRR
jgi:hypothetical protein